MMDRDISNYRQQTIRLSCFNYGTNRQADSYTVNRSIDRQTAMKDKYCCIICRTDGQTQRHTDTLTVEQMDRLTDT